MNQRKIEPREYPIGEALAILTEAEVRSAVRYALLLAYRTQEGITGRGDEGQLWPTVQKSSKADV